jgi:hypothetical protein
MIPYSTYTHGKIIVNRASTILGHISWLNCRGNRLQIVINEVLAAVVSRTELEILPAPPGK